MKKLITQLNQPTAPRRLWLTLLSSIVESIGNIRRDYRITQLEKRLDLLEGRP